MQNPNQNSNWNKRARNLVNLQNDQPNGRMLRMGVRREHNRDIQRIQIEEQQDAIQPNVLLAQNEINEVVVQGLVNNLQNDDNPQPNIIILEDQQFPDLDMSEDLDNLFDEQLNLEQQQRLFKDEFIRRHGELSRRVKEKWYKPPFNAYPGMRKLVNFEQQIRGAFRGGDFENGLDLLNEWERCINDVELIDSREQQRDNRSKSMTEYDPVAGMDLIQKQTERAGKFDNDGDEVIDVDYKIVLQAFGNVERVAQKRPKEVVKSDDFLIARSVCRQFLDTYAGQYEQKNDTDRGQADLRHHWADRLKVCREMLWKLDSFEQFSDSKNLESNKKKLEKTKNRDDKMRVQAEILTETGPQSPDNPGASASFMLKSPDGKNAFIFKPQAGEKAQPGWPQGGGAPREVLFSKLNEYAMSSLGVDFGVCPTTTVKLKNEKFASMGKNGVVGALQEGAVCTGDLASLCGRGGLNRERNPNLERDMARINVEDVQKIAMLDFLTLNLDRQFDNVLVNDTGGDVRLIPIDAGNAMPPPDVFREQTTGDDHPLGNAMTATPVKPGDGLTDGQNALAQLPQSQLPFSREMQETIQNINVEEMIQQLKNAEQNLPREMRGKISEETFEMMRRSAAFLKAACGVLSVFELSDAYAANVDGFQDILDAPPQNLQQTIQQVINATKQRCEIAARERQLDAEREEFLKRYGEELVKLKWERQEIINNFDQFDSALNGGWTKPDKLKEYAAAGGDERYAQLNPNGDADDFLLVKLKVLMDANDETLQTEYDKLTQTLGWSRQELLDNKGWVGAILENNWNRPERLNRYDELDGDDAYSIMSSQPPDKAFLLNRIADLERLSHLEKQLHWPREYLRAHANWIGQIESKQLDYDTLANDYALLGGDQTYTWLSTQAKPNSFLTEKLRELQKLVNAVHTNGWDVETSRPLFQKWGVYFASTSVQATCQRYLELGGDDIFEQNSPQDADSVFILDRIDLLETLEREMDLRDFQEGLERADEFIRRANSDFETLVSEAIQYDTLIRDLVRQLLGAPKLETKTAKTFLSRARRFASQIGELRKTAAQRLHDISQRFAALAPSVEHARRVKKTREREKVELIKFKIAADNEKFESVENSVKQSLEQLEAASRGKLQVRDAWLKVVFADAKRFTRIEYQPLGGADSSIDTDLKSLAERLADLNDQTPVEELERVYLATRNRLNGLELELPKILRKIEVFTDSLTRTVNSYPKELEADEEFTKAFQDFRSCAELAEELRENMETKYPQKILSMRQLLD